MLEALESGRAYSSLSLSTGGGGDGEDDLDPLESIGSEEHQYEVSENRAVLAPGFRALDERERMILQLRFFDGLTQSQIAQQVGISQMHVSRLIRRSLEKIRDEIASDEEPRPAAPAADAAAAVTLPRAFYDGAWPQSSRECPGQSPFRRSRDVRGQAP